MSYNRILEGELINGLKEGDKSAFSFLFKMYYTPLCTYASTIIKLPNLAEEVVQESFIKIWENRQQIRIDSSLRAYFYRCIHNNCLNYIKNLNVNQRRTDIVTKEITYHAELATLNFSEEILDKIVSDELEIFFDKIIDELPGQCKEIFCLSRYEQLTYPEIAEKLQISVNTVKTQISRALDKLRDAYNKN
jgi:RNA polymerase sigma-70 factor (ECF subfamily)